jgi:hypothetical protein
MDHYWGLCSAILLDCDDHAAFTRVVAALKAASIELHSIAFDYRTRAKVAELEASNEVVASRVRRYNSVVAQFQGRCLFWTKQGFHGLSSPGVGGCGHAVVLLDGLSFPMVVRDDDKQLVGCAIIRGVDMQGEVAGGLQPGEEDCFQVCVGLQGSLRWIWGRQDRPFKNRDAQVNGMDPLPIKSGIH